MGLRMSLTRRWLKMIPVINLLRNWKVILGAVGLASIVSVGVFFKGIYDENSRLESRLTEASSTIQKQKQDYKLLEKSLVQYQSNLKEQRIKNDSLRVQLNRLGDTNDQLQECLDTSLPDDIIDGLRK